MSAILNAAPKAILQGLRTNLEVYFRLFRNRSLPPAAYFSVHRKGPLDAQLVSGGSATRMYSAKTFDVRSKYANHQTLLTNIVNGNGNAMMIQRMKPEDAAPPATLGLALEVLADDVPVYERGDDDSLTLDQDGNPIPTGDMIPGHKTRWVLRELTDNAIGTGQSMAGSLSNAGDTAQSTIYPIADLQVADFGSHGNLKASVFGLRPPNLRPTPPMKKSSLTKMRSCIAFR